MPHPQRRPKRSRRKPARSARAGEFQNSVLPEEFPGNTILAVTTISLKLPQRLLQRLEAEARNRRASKSALVRECLEQALGAPTHKGAPSCFDLAQDLAGSLQGLPRDLASNPKYFDGFGR